MADEQEGGIWIDGEQYFDEDLTYREQHEVRRIVREWNSDVEDFELDDAAPVDLIPAIYCVIKRRSEPGFTSDMALDIKPSDHQKPKAQPNRAARRSKAKTGAGPT